MERYDEDAVYAIDGHYLNVLDRIQRQLHEGTDRERDFGHRVWLVLDQFHELREGRDNG